MAQVLDYSSRPPSGATVRSAGYPGVVRYAGTPGRPKNITRAEFEDMDMSGVGVALVYENQAGDALNGFGAGQASARAILADANHIGFPPSRPLYFACDRDIVTEQQFTAVMSYLDGAASVIGAQRVGVYGEHDVVKRALEGGHARYGWQTVAWSGGKHYAGAHLYQLAGYVYPGGVQCDASNVLQADWGQHNYVTTLEDDVAFTDKITVASPGDRNYKESGEAGQFIGDTYFWTSDMYKAVQGVILPAVAALVAGTGQGLDQAAVMARIDTAVREATGQAVTGTVLPALQSVLATALGADRKDEADAIVTAMAARLAPTPPATA